VEGEELGELVLLDQVADGDDRADVLEELHQLIFRFLVDHEVLVSALLVDGPLPGVVEEVRLEVVVDAALEVGPKLPGLHLVHVEELELVLGEVRRGWWAWWGVYTPSFSIIPRE